MVKEFNQYPTDFYKATAKLAESKKELIRSQTRRDGISKAQIAGLKPQTCLILVWIYWFVVNNQSDVF
jgi:hypothetical protein